MNGGINYFDDFYHLAPGDARVLERNVNDHPYSSLAAFLLLYHYKKTSDPRFEILAKKTALHFKTANWLQFLLDYQPAERPTSFGTNRQDHIKEQTELYRKAPEEIQEILYDQNHGYEVQELKQNDGAPVDELQIPGQAPEEKSGRAPASLNERHFQPAQDAVQGFPPTDTEISFEPLHTVDYFASQGIKLTDESVTNDKLGNQMKSFTAWLKSMKKLHPSKLEEQDAATEKLIQSSAEESNISTEVLTEAMAEVLIKQDKKEKAIEMYNKLSLINPSKRVYFAAKIESIKSS